MSPEAIVATLRKFGLSLDVEAADLIEKLQSENARLRPVLYAADRLITEMAHDGSHTESSKRLATAVMEASPIPSQERHTP